MVGQRLADPAVTGDMTRLGATVDEQERLLHAFDRAGGPRLRNRAEGLLRELGIGRDHWDLPLAALSGGQRKLVGLAACLIGDPDLSEAVYRLAKAAREGRRLQEEVRLTGPPPRWLRFRVRPLGTTGGAARSTVWSVADVTRDRERQENVFQELQHAIDYLDHAPAGFFSVDAAGDIGYLNATLGQTWLPGTGENSLGDLPAGTLKLGGVPFEARGVIQLAGEQTDRLEGRFAAAVGGIKVGRSH